MENYYGPKMSFCLEMWLSYVVHYAIKYFPWQYNTSESEAPPTKKVKTSSVVVEQTGQSDRLLIDQVTDAESIFDEVSGIIKQ